VRGTVSADLEAVNAGLIGGQGADLAGHLGHAARCHIGLGLEQHRAGDRLVSGTCTRRTVTAVLPGPAGWA